MNYELYDLAGKVGLILREKQLFIVTAESCTGGLLATTLTDIPGSSTYFERGFIAYGNIAKQEMLNVRLKSLKKFGAVSEQVAQEMAEGALQNSHSQVAVAITGIAGPDGGSEDKSVGTVCIAWARLELPTKTITVHLSGDRISIRQQAVKVGLNGLLALYYSCQNCYI